MASSEQILSALDTLRCGVYIVTSSFRKNPAGCTCVWITRLSFDPPLIGVSLAPERNTLKVIESGKRFCVNVMGESGLPMARRFGFSNDGEVGPADKFDGVTYTRSKSGALLLDNAVSFIDCNLHSVMAMGDHMLVHELWCGLRCAGV